MIFGCHPEYRHCSNSGGFDGLCEFYCCGGFENRVIRACEKTRLLPGDDSNGAGRELLYGIGIAGERRTQLLAVTGVEKRPLTGKCGDRVNRILLRIKLAHAPRARNVIKKERRHRRQAPEGNAHHEISASSLFILRKTCTRSSRCADFTASSGRRGKPDSNPSSSIAHLRPAIPCFSVTAAAAGAIIRCIFPD